MLERLTFRVMAVWEETKGIVVLGSIDFGVGYASPLLITPSF